MNAYRINNAVLLGKSVSRSSYSTSKNQEFSSDWTLFYSEITLQMERQTKSPWPVGMPGNFLDCLFRIAHLTVGSTIPVQVNLGCIKKLAKPKPANKP